MRPNQEILAELRADGLVNQRHVERVGAALASSRTFVASLAVAVLSIVGVLVTVVRTGRDGRVADWLAVVAVAALVLAWRLRPQGPRESLTD